MHSRISKVVFINWLLILLGEPVGVGSVAGGGRYDNLVGMFDPRKRKVRRMSVIYKGCVQRMCALLIHQLTAFKTIRTVI